MLVLGGTSAAQSNTCFYSWRQKTHLGKVFLLKVAGLEVCSLLIMCQKSSLCWYPRLNGNRKTWDKSLSRTVNCMINPVVDSLSISLYLCLSVSHSLLLSLPPSLALFSPQDSRVDNNWSAVLYINLFICTEWAMELGANTSEFSPPWTTFPAPWKVSRWEGKPVA